MDKRNERIQDIITILKEVKDSEINDLDMNLFGSYFNYSAGDMLEVCMVLRTKYNINLDTFIHNIEEYTINNLADALCKVMTTKDEDYDKSSNFR